MIKSNRLDFLANLLKESRVVLDIGTDHGLLLKKAFDLNYIKKGFATDINADPLSSAKKNLSGYDVLFFKTDGFKGLDELDHDTVVIAGMGSNLISRILSDAKKDVKYIIQSNDKYSLLRKNLQDMGFRITDEYVIFDGFYYVIMIVYKGAMNLSEEDIIVGPVLKKKPERTDYYNHKINIFNNLLETVPKDKKDELKKTMSYYQKNL